MPIIDLVPSPSHALSLPWIGLSMFSSSILGSTRRPSEPRHSPLIFDVDVDTGFFPSRPPPHLPQTFERWEQALEDAHDALYIGDKHSEMNERERRVAEQWRENIRSWPTISTESISRGLRMQQRAHLVLAWLVHYYVHSLPPSSDEEPVHVPASLAVPLVEVSRALGIAPILTFADTVLWNWEPVDPTKPVSTENIRFVNLFSGTDDERNFYTTSAAAEFRGVEFLRIINDHNSLPADGDLDFATVSKIARDLTRIATIVAELSEVIQSVRNVVDPHVFYWDIRPWYEGADAKGPDAPGWVYDGVGDTAKLDLSGPSAGQSSVMHALDKYLDIDHTLSARRRPAPSPENRRADTGFMARMQRYMPGLHRAYLENVRPIRELARRTPALREPYDGAVLALKKLRDLHMRIAVLYIVSMSHTAPPGVAAGCPVAIAMQRMQARKAEGNGPARGTGGNELSSLLKASRDATRRAALKEN